MAADSFCFLTLSAYRVRKLCEGTFYAQQVVSLRMESISPTTQKKLGESSGMKGRQEEGSGWEMDAVPTVKSHWLRQGL